MVADAELWVHRDINGVTKIGDFGLAVLRHAWVR